MTEEQPRKVDASHIEVIGKSGEVIQEAADHAPHSNFQGFSGVKVIRGGPAMLLLLPLMIPVILVGVVLLMVSALLFGRSVFKLIALPLRRR